MTRELKIDDAVINDASECYVIAEIGHNHQGDMQKCMDLFAAAKDCGADAVKLQKRDNRSLFTKSMYDSVYSSENAFGSTYGEHRENLEFDLQQFRELKEYADSIDVSFYSTAFDTKSADLLMEVGVPAFKMASGDLYNIPLLKHVAKLGKPMIVSTGGGEMDDVKRARDAIMPINPQLAILQCTAGYPPEFGELNLRVIETFREEFPENVIGFSSHDNGIAMSLVAYMLGGRIVEKHFTINRAWKGTDQSFSLERSGFTRMVRDLKRARVALGDGAKRRYPSEKGPMFKMAKKLVAARPLAANHVLTESDIAIKSPSDGLPPYEIDKLLGRKLRRGLAEDENITFEDVG